MMKERLLSVDFFRGITMFLLISGELSCGHWVSFNAIPTIAHTVWGVLMGKLLLA